MGDTLVDLTRIFEGTSGQNVDAKSNQGSDSVSLIALKFTSENIDVAKKITTEGFSTDERKKYIRKVSGLTDSEIFEFSTCNRVLYVGFGIEPDELCSKICELNDIRGIDFDLFEGTSAWRQLVKICSGLDSFIIGELQVMSQFRKAVNFHRDHNLISHYNSAFFEHVIAANRTIRKQLGFTQTTESMLSLATASLENLLAEKGQINAVVLGFGEMGSKAAEALVNAGQTNIVVVSRDPAASSQRHPDLAKYCMLISYEEWENNDKRVDLVISTTRNANAIYHSEHPIPITSKATLMDFAWPPSIDESGINEEHVLLGMEHWIKMSRNLGEEWNYNSIIDKSDSMINTVHEHYAEALNDKSEAKFRAFIYAKMEQMSKKWEESPDATIEDIPQLGAFSREIATWICHQPAPFYLSNLSNFVINTERKLSSAVLSHVNHDVKRSVTALNKGYVRSGGAS